MKKLFKNRVDSTYKCDLDDHISQFGQKLTDIITEFEPTHAAFVGNDSIFQEIGYPVGQFITSEHGSLGSLDISAYKITLNNAEGLLIMSADVIGNDSVLFLKGGSAKVIAEFLSNLNPDAIYDRNRPAELIDIIKSMLSDLFKFNFEIDRSEVME